MTTKFIFFTGDVTTLGHEYSLQLEDESFTSNIYCESL
jgi:hypothetical protein